MKSILSLALACTAAFAASRAETTTYVDGNLTGISANTGGTLLFSDDNTMVFRTGLATVTIPYNAVTKSELGATRETSHGAPIYKVWARHKKTETQFLTVEFKNEEGEAKTMTLELAQAAAPSVLAAIQDHAGKAEVAKADPAPAGAPVQDKPVMQDKPMVKPTPSATTLANNKPIVNRNDQGSVASPATKAGSDWWGDDIWKTTRNASTWGKPTATTAPEE